MGDEDNLSLLKPIVTLIADIRIKRAIEDADLERFKEQGKPLTIQEDIEFRQKTLEALKKSGEWDKIIATNLETIEKLKTQIIENGEIKITNPLANGVPTITSLNELDQVIETLISKQMAAEKLAGNGKKPVPPILIDEEKVIKVNPENIEEVNKAIVEKLTTTLIKQGLSLKHIVYQNGEFLMAEKVHDTGHLLTSDEANHYLTDNEKKRAIQKLIPNEFKNLSQTWLDLGYHKGKYHILNDTQFLTEEQRKLKIHSKKEYERLEKLYEKELKTEKDSARSKERSKRMSIKGASNDEGASEQPLDHETIMQGKTFIAGGESHRIKVDDAMKFDALLQANADKPFTPEHLKAAAPGKNPELKVQEVA